MKYRDLFLYEWKHFIRSPFKIIALVLFVVAGVYGLNKGASLHEQHEREIEKIEKRASEDRQKVIDDYFITGELNPEDRPWIDYGTPFWSIWFSYVHHFKNPSPAMVYSIGQSEQFGFYKRVTFWASPYDADLAEEIANPERLQTGTLDFSFTILFLLPLVLLVLLYNLKSWESEQGFMQLILVQMPSKNIWLASRVSFYIFLLVATILALLLVGTALTPVFEHSPEAFTQMLFFCIAYLLFWAALYFIFLSGSKTVLGNTLKMSTAYLLFAFIIPASVHQVLSTQYPPNMMTDFIDVRDRQQELYNQPDSLFQAKLNELYPEILVSSVYKDSTKRGAARNRSAASLVNELKKSSLLLIEEEFEKKNAFIEGTFWFSPVSYFQNRFNTISGTHFDDYQTYRNDVQTLIDKQIRTMVLDTWNNKKIDRSGYEKYIQELEKL